jgi:hypothetical protein
MVKRFTDWLRGKAAAPALRNKAGGMAWVLSAGMHSGAESLAGSAVKTVALQPNGMWRIEPLLGYVATGPQSFANGAVFQPGDVVVIGAIADSALEPWKDTGLTESEVRELFAPRLSSVEAA